MSPGKTLCLSIAENSRANAGTVKACNRYNEYEESPMPCNQLPPIQPSALSQNTIPETSSAAGIPAKTTLSSIEEPGVSTRKPKTPAAIREKEARLEIR
ncbi:hypothetical protein D3C72_1934340 [compost metagenome]